MSVVRNCTEQWSSDRFCWSKADEQLTLIWCNTCKQTAVSDAKFFGNFFGGHLFNSHLWYSKSDKKKKKRRKCWRTALKCLASLHTRGVSANFFHPTVPLPTLQECLLTDQETNRDTFKETKVWEKDRWLYKQTWRGGAGGGEGNGLLRVCEWRKTEKEQHIEMGEAENMCPSVDPRCSVA